MPRTDDFCLVCGDTCTCQTKGKRRKIKSVPVARPSVETPQALPAESQPERRPPRRATSRTTEGVTVDEEDESMISAVRALAYLVAPEDLAPFAEHLKPWDYVSPKEKAASWRRGINDSHGSDS